ncbi:hypothetical protein B0H10DRAFT_1966110 [Mycena sp. CBHHK59/15]|nr:hypothetical protein B0H10DRAFT_1966110 [Mycena sp. CBHHK59/15]
MESCKAPGAMTKGSTGNLKRQFCLGLPSLRPRNQVRETVFGEQELLHEIDSDWAADIGEEMVINRRIEVAMYGFGPRNDEGIFKIPTRGPGIEAFADVLNVWLLKYRTAEHLIRWLNNAAAEPALWGKHTTPRITGASMRGPSANLYDAAAARKLETAARMWNTRNAPALWHTFWIF